MDSDHSAPKRFLEQSDLGLHCLKRTGQTLVKLLMKKQDDFGVHYFAYAQLYQMYNMSSGFMNSLIVYRISSVVRWSFFPSKTIPKI